MIRDGENPTGEMVYDQSVDIWGLGIVACMLVTGVHPLRGLTSWRQFLEHMNSGKMTRFDDRVWAPISEPCKDLLRQILRPEPTRRATPAQILAHEWIAGGIASQTLLPSVIEGLSTLHASGLQKLVLQVMESRLSADKLAETTQLFAALDLDKTGVIRRSELATVLAKHHEDRNTARILDTCFDALDLKGDGVVSLAEFRAAVLAENGQLLHSLLRPVFEEIDTHQTGDISAEEVAAIFAKLGGEGAAISQDEAQELIRQYDENGEGTLNFQEFAKMMSQESLHNGER